MLKLATYDALRTNPVLYLWSKVKGENVVSKLISKCEIQKLDKKISELTFDDLLRLSSKSKEEVIQILKTESVAYREEVKLPPLDFFRKPLVDIRKIMALGYTVSRNSSELELLFQTDKLVKVVHAKKLLPAKAVELTSTNACYNYWTNVESFHAYYKSLSYLEDTWRRVLFYCLYDAYALGADFVRFVHSFNTCEYSFSAQDKVFSGKIDHRVLKGLSRLANDSNLDAECMYDSIFPVGRGSCIVENSESSTHIVVSFNEASKKAEVIQLSTPATSHKQNKTPHVLLIDDDEKFLSYVKKGIASKGYKVSISVSANDALLMYLNSNADIDLVVTDLHMPHVSGVELVRTIKSYNKDLPIIALTSDEDTESEISLIRAGANTVIHKQDDPKLLFVWMQKLLGKNLNSL